MNIKFESHRVEIEKALKEAVERALEAIGIQCESHAKNNITQAGRIGVSGRLRNSVAHQVVVGEKAVYIGSDLEYALYNEVGTGIYAEGGGGRKDPWRYQDEKGEWHRTVGMKPIHFLKNAVADHQDEYVAIAKQMMQQ